MKLTCHPTTRQNGHLAITRQDCVTLTRKYGTPHSVTREDSIMERPAWQ